MLQQLARPFVVSFGAGVDSTAMLIGLHERRIRPDAILWADTGSEHPETYRHVREVVPPLLAALGFPELEIVRTVPKAPRHGAYSTLEENCLVNRTLPSAAFGRKGCSQKWKGEPLDRRCAELFAEHLAAGGVVDRAIGYEANEARRGGTYSATSDTRWNWVYPLREWGWTRADCEAKLAEWELTVRKSSCFFCPHMSCDELRELATDHPELAARAVAIEDQATPYLRNVGGLWRRPRKGARGAEPRPASWRAFLDEQGLLPAETLIRSARERVTTTKPAAPEPASAPSDGWVTGEAVDRSGMAAYTHLIRADDDPERSPREDRADRRTAWRRELSKERIPEWRDAIFAHLADGGARTFNRITVELGDVTADVAFMKAPDLALWSLVHAGLVEHTTTAPILFRRTA